MAAPRSLTPRANAAPALRAHAALNYPIDRRVRARTAAAAVLTAAAQDGVRLPATPPPLAALHCDFFGFILTLPLLPKMNLQSIDKITSIWDERRESQT
jgi:hypothetical protein